MEKNNVLLFNPVSIVHDRNVSIFKENLLGWRTRCIYNPRNPRLADMEKAGGDTCFFSGGRTKGEVFEDVGAVVLFTAQARVPPAYLIQEAAFRGIPVIAIEEVYQMMFEQGFVNEYILPTDHLFVGSDYEKEKFVEMGVPRDAVKTTGCVFSFKKNIKRTADRTNEIKRRLNISGNKRIATLCLAYITPNGETLDIRRELLSVVSEGLPPEYELVVKPHPAERTEDIITFIKSYAPNARVAGAGEPIDNILDFTDVLFNRGNSQVIIDAIQRGIPAAAIPMGRKTLFEGLLDELVVRRPGDITGILALIRDRGMRLYEPILKRYLHVSPEESLERTISGLVEIARRRELYKPQERLLAISLFWAFMGYPSQALNTLSRTMDQFDIDRSVEEKIRKLVLRRADHADISFLKKWAGPGYREWVIKSLWIKSLYITGRKLLAEDREWLAEFPPRTNREDFMPFAKMLGRTAPVRYFNRRTQIILKDILKDALFRYGAYR